MNAHVYGNPPLDVEESGDPEQLKTFKAPAAKKPSLKCDPHEPGLVAVSDPSRLYCFGSAELHGKRVCDRHVADYTQLHDTYVGIFLYICNFSPWDVLGLTVVFLSFFGKSQKNWTRRVRTVQEKVCFYSFLPYFQVYSQFAWRCAADGRNRYSNFSGILRFDLRILTEWWEEDGSWKNPSSSGVVKSV